MKAYQGKTSLFRFVVVLARFLSPASLSNALISSKNYLEITAYLKPDTLEAQETTSFDFVEFGLPACNPHLFLHQSL